MHKLCEPLEKWRLQYDLHKLKKRLKRKHMPGWEQLGMQAAQQGVGALFGLALGSSQDRRQLNMERKLQRMNMEGSKEMTNYNMMKQLEMWKNTSYPAQMAMMKQAGLNPALMYGSSGPGGMTNLATGNVSQGAAPKGGGEIMGLMNMGLQSQMTQAQIENIKADTENKKATTPKIGAETQLIGGQLTKIIAETKNEQAKADLIEGQRILQNIDITIAGATQNLTIANVQYQTDQAFNQLQILKNQKDISDQTKQAVIQETQIKAITAALNAALIESNIENTKQSTQESIARVQTMQAQVAKMAQDIAQGWANVGLRGKELTNEQARTAIQQEWTKIGWWKIGTDTLGKIGDVILNIQQKAGQIISMIPAGGGIPRNPVGFQIPK